MKIKDKISPTTSKQSKDTFFGLHFSPSFIHSKAWKSSKFLSKIYMSLLSLALSVVGLLMFAMFQFMLVAFSAGGIANGNKLSAWQMSVLNMSIYLLPALSVITAAALIYFYVSHSPYLSLKWHFLPLATTVIYFAFAKNLN